MVSVRPQIKMALNDEIASSEQKISELKDNQAFTSMMCSGMVETINSQQTGSNGFTELDAEKDCIVMRVSKMSESRRSLLESSEVNLQVDFDIKVTAINTVTTGTG